MTTDIPQDQREILLVGVNAGYIHSAFALRCLRANLGPLRERAWIVETDEQEATPVQLVERLLAGSPKVIGFSVYVWNVAFVAATLRLLRVVAPHVGIVLGGPQLVPDAPDETLCGLADAVVCGEAEGIAADVFAAVLEGRRGQGTLTPEPPDLACVELPYPLYTDADLATRVVYAETTRGCPFACSYCTSAGSGGIRRFPLETLLPALRTLLDRGARGLKFLDRSFNHGGEHALAVLDFLLAEWREGLTAHFEFTPQPLAPAWRDRLLRFPPGALHVEVGIQTWDAAVARRIHRPFDAATAEETLRFLIDTARADIHADLIAGLPGEDSESFARGFDRLLALRPAELQVGILKLLPGTAMTQMAREFDMRFAPDPPYEILATDRIPFAHMRRLARFARCWELLYNRKRFRHTAPLLWTDGGSPFEGVMAVADWLHSRYGRLHALAPKQLAEAIVETRPPGRRTAARAALENDARKA